MNNLSLNGKNWILKKFNEEDVLYLKENFFRSEKQKTDLDEVGWFSNGSGGFINKLMGKGVLIRW